MNPNRYQVHARYYPHDPGPALYKTNYITEAQHVAHRAKGVILDSRISRQWWYRVGRWIHLN